MIAFAAALALAFTGTLWQEATFSEMNGLHLFIVALLLHRALVWRDERRDRDLVLGALLGGLCVSNHGLAITVVPIVVLFVLADARREITARPVLLVKAGAAFALGLLPYLYLPLRALAGPAETYSPFLTLEGLFAHISGAQFRGDMHFASIDSVKAALSAAPAGLRSRPRPVEPRLRRPRRLRDRTARHERPMVRLAAGAARGRERLLLRELPGRPVALPADRLAHPRRSGWPTRARRSSRSWWKGSDPRLAVAAFAMLVMPAVLLASNWATHDQSANRDGERFTEEVFAALPPDAVLLTYWDALTPLSYMHCIEGVRPDVSLRAYDEKALVTCDPIERPLTDVARRRPVYALLVVDDKIEERTGLVPVPVQDFVLPWGQRYPQLDSLALPAGATRPGSLRWTPATPFSTSGVARGSSGSVSGSPTGRTRAPSVPAAIRRPGAPPTCASTAIEGGAAMPSRSRGRSRSTGCELELKADRRRPGRALPGARGDAAVAARPGRGAGGGARPR